MEGHPSTPPVTRNTKTRQRLYAATAVFILVVVAVGIFELTTSNSSNVVRVATVRITSSGFQPATLSVKQGTKVTWTNDDATLHQIMANPFPKGTGLPGLKSQILNNGQTYTYVASTSGTFGYHDQLKPTTNGTLIVQIVQKK